MIVAEQLDLPAEENIHRWLFSALGRALAFCIVFVFVGIRASAFRSEPRGAPMLWLHVKDHQRYSGGPRLYSRGMQRPPRHPTLRIAVSRPLSTALVQVDEFAQECIANARPMHRTFEVGGRPIPELHYFYISPSVAAGHFALGCRLD